MERDALIAWQQKGFKNCFVTLEMVGIIDADARGSEPILANGCTVGRSTNDGYGWRVGKSLAMATVESASASRAKSSTSLSSASPRKSIRSDNTRLKG